MCPSSRSELRVYALTIRPGDGPLSIVCDRLLRPPLTPPAWFAFDDLGTVHEVEADRYLITEGHPTRRFVMILDGAVGVSEQGFELTIRESGDYCGEIGLLDRLGGGPGLATATVVTRRPSLLRSLAPWEFKKLLGRSADARAEVIEQARRRLRRPS